MKRGIHTVRCNRPVNQHFQRSPQIGLRLQPPDHIGKCFLPLLHMPPLQFSRNRLLIREVLIKRRDIHSRAVGHPVRRKLVPSILYQNVSSGF